MAYLLLYQPSKQGAARSIAVYDYLVTQGMSCVVKQSAYWVFTTTGLYNNPRILSFLETQQQDFAWFPKHIPSPQDIRVCAMDMDSTVINIECIDEIARLAGCVEQVQSITEATMRGEISNFSESLRQRVALLKGTSLQSLETIYHKVMQFNPGVPELLQGLQRHGVATILLSGGFTFFADKVQERLGFTAAYANKLEVEQGCLTGRVLGDIVDAEAKKQHLQAFCAQHQVDMQQALAIGDGANDLKMLGASGYGVAYQAKPVVRAQAAYAIHHQPLDVLLCWFDAARELAHAQRL